MGCEEYECFVSPRAEDVTLSTKYQSQPPGGWAGALLHLRGMQAKQFFFPSVEPSSPRQPPSTVTLEAQTY